MEAVQNFYPVFEPNQVLTAEQLNELAAYLEQQERLTRSKLIGVGIVCGLRVRMERSGSTLTAIHISAGCGITSDGYVVVAPDCALTRHHPYEVRAGYPHFGGETVVELLTADQAVDLPSEPVSNLALDDRVLVLFLECKDVNIDACTDDACDEKGQRREFTLRKLLIDREFLNMPEPLPPLPPVEVSRLSNLAGLGTPVTLDKLRSEYLRLVNLTVPALNTALPAIHSHYAAYLPENLFSALDLNPLVTANHRADVASIQYVHDFIKDLALGYNELVSAAHDVHSACCAAGQNFPKHLLLGRADATDPNAPSPYRQAFIHAPIHERQAQQVAQLGVLYRRLRLMIDTFSVPQSAEMAVTPSREKETELGERTVPYYYSQGDLAQLKIFWNYELTRRGRSPRPYTPGGALLSRNLDDHAFLRIEGHLGQSYPAARDFLRRIIRKYNLPVELRGVKLGSDAAGTERFLGCRAQDLETIYAALRSELICLLQKEVRFFANLDLVLTGTYEDSDTSGVRGKVTDDKGRPLPGVNVLIHETSQATSTNAAGEFSIDLEPGDYNLAVAAAGFNSQTIPIKIIENKRLVVTVEMQPFRINFPGFFTRGGLSGISTGNNNGGKKTGGRPFGGATKFSGTPQFKYSFTFENLGTAQPGKYTLGQFLDYVQKQEGVVDIRNVATEFFGKIPTLVNVLVFNDLYMLRVFYPEQLIRRIETLVSTVPEGLNSFDFAAFSTGYDAMEQTAHNYKKEYREYLRKPGAIRYGDEAEIFKHLDFILDACSLKKFRDLAVVVQKRIAEIQKLNLFDAFLEKHPGLEHQAGVIKGGTFVLVYDEGGRVVADFSLPYICCSDCPPVMICESRAVVFKLPKEKFCKAAELDDAGNPKRYKFIISPPGGEVSGRGGETAPGVMRDEQTGDYFFTPAAADVPVGTLGFEYHLDEQVYELTVEISEITADFEWEVLSVDPQKNTATVQFTGQSGDAVTYKWDFGDGTSGEGKSVTHTYQPIPEGPVTVTLTVTAEDCEASTSQTIPIEPCSAAFEVTVEETPADVTITAKSITPEANHQWQVLIDGNPSAEGSDPEITVEVKRSEKEQQVTIRHAVDTGVCQSTAEQTVPVPPLQVPEVAHLQIIHNAPDVNLKEIAVLRNGQPLLDKLAFRQATPFREVPAGAAKLIALNPADGAELHTIELTLEAGRHYVAIFTGVQNPTKIKVPDNRDISLRWVVTPAKIESGNPQLTILLFQQGVVDLPVLDVLFEGSPAEIKALGYNAFTEYFPFDAAIEKLLVLFRFNGQVVPVFTGDLRPLANLGATAFFSGILSPDFDLPIQLHAALPDGRVIEFPPFTRIDLQFHRFLAIAGRNARTVTEAPADPRFVAVLTPDEPVFRNTVTAIAKLSEELGIPALREKYRKGQQNVQLANTFAPLLRNATEKIAAITGPGAIAKRQFVYEKLYLPQLVQLIGVVNLQEKDLSPQSTLGRVLAGVPGQLRDLAALKVKLNENNTLSTVLAVSEELAAARPAYRKVLGEIGGVLP